MAAISMGCAPPTVDCVDQCVDDLARPAEAAGCCDEFAALSACVSTTPCDPAPCDAEDDAYRACVAAAPADAGPGDAAGSGMDGGGGVDAGPQPDAGQCFAECAGWSATFVRGCGTDDNCVGFLHSQDCCGNGVRAYGMNHSEAATFCPADAACRASYPPPDLCSEATFATDTGDSVMFTANIGVRCNAGTCETFACGTGSFPACPAVDRLGSCGP
jgi:hypothetical protein